MEIGWKWYLPRAEYPEYSFGTVDYLYGEPLGTAGTLRGLLSDRAVHRTKLKRRIQRA